LSGKSAKTRANEDIRPFIAIVVLIIEGYYRITRGVWPLTPLVVAVVPLIYFTLVPRAMRPFANGLMHVVNRLGKINNVLVLSVLFYLVLTPVGFVMRLLRGARIELRTQKSLESYWKDRPGKGQDIDFTKMY
jgi:hypothetical protein